MVVVGIMVVCMVGRRCGSRVWNLVAHTGRRAVIVSMVAMAPCTMLSVDHAPCRRRGHAGEREREREREREEGESDEQNTKYVTRL